MISDTTLQNYFNRHLLAPALNAFSAAERSAACFTADLDVAAVFGRSVNDGDDALLCAAVAEQTIHLLLHRDSLSPAETQTDMVSETIDGIGSRSYRVSRREPELLCERAKTLLSGAMTTQLSLKRG